MESNLSYGQIWKGSNAQISVPVLPPYCTAITADMVVDFYTTDSASSVSFSQTAGTLSVSGQMGTVMFQPAQLEALEDGQLKYCVKYTSSGIHTVVALETRWFIKTPNPYTPVDFATKTYVDEKIGQAVITGATYTAGQNIDIANRVISVTGITSVTKTSQLQNDSGFLTQHQSLADYYTSAQTDSAIASATTDMATQTWVEGQGYLTEHQSLSGKQDTLVSGENIKTINNQSILGSGNIEISGGSGSAQWGQITGSLSAQTDLSNELATKVKGNNVLEIWSGTLAEYNALSSHSSGTIYFIK